MPKAIEGYEYNPNKGYYDYIGMPANKYDQNAPPGARTMDIRPPVYEDGSIVPEDKIEPPKMEPLTKPGSIYSIKDPAEFEAALGYGPKDFLVPKKQKGKPIEEIKQPNDRYYESILLKNRSKPFVDRMFKVEAPKLKEQGYDVTHKMASAEVNGKFIAFPTVQIDNAKTLKDLSKTRDGGLEQALKAGNFIEFDTPEAAEDFAMNYKRGIAKYDRPSRERTQHLREFAKGSVTIESALDTLSEIIVDHSRGRWDAFKEFLKEGPEPLVPKEYETKEEIEAYMKTDEFNQRLFDLAMSFESGGMIAGKKLINRFVKQLELRGVKEGFRTWRKLALEHPHIYQMEKSRRTAYKLQQAGKSDAFIQKTTGWRPEPGSNRFTYVFSDKAMKFKPEFVKGAGKNQVMNFDQMLDRQLVGKHVKLRDLIDHPEFEKYYGFLLDKIDDVGVRFDPLSSTSTAPSWASEMSKDRPLVIGLLSKDEKIGQKTVEEFRQTILHELTHVVQSFESFFRGGSPKEFMGFWKKLAKQQGVAPNKIDEWAEENARMFYYKFQGEIQARATAAMGHMSSKELRRINPWTFDPKKSAAGPVKRAIRMQDFQDVKLSDMFPNQEIAQDWIRQLDPALTERGVKDIYLPPNDAATIRTVRGALDRKKADMWMKDTIERIDEAGKFRVREAGTGPGREAGFAIQGFNPKTKTWEPLFYTSRAGDARDVVSRWNQRKLDSKAIKQARKEVDNILGQIDVPMSIQQLLD